RVSGALSAIKTLRDDCPNPQTAKTLLENEAEVGQQVQSEHVVRVVRGALEHLRPHLVLEWLSGETLEVRLRRSRRLHCREALWIARQVAQGLCDLVTAGYTHGDVKPSNIFICRNGAVKLIDLGFARSDRRRSRELTEAGASLAGTPEYLAPEALVP